MSRADVQRSDAPPGVSADEKAALLEEAQPEQSVRVFSYTVLAELIKLVPERPEVADARALIDAVARVVLRVEASPQTSTSDVLRMVSLASQCIETAQRVIALAPHGPHFDLPRGEYPSAQWPHGVQR